MKTFYIFDHPHLPTPYNHRFFVEKFSRGFLYHGFEVRVVKTVEEVTSPGYVMISNHEFYYHFGNDSKGKSFLRSLFITVSRFDATGLFNRFCKWLKFRVVRSLATQIRDKDIVLIVWFWHLESDFISGLGIRTIFTGDYSYDEGTSPGQKQWRAFFLNRRDAIPIRFSADCDPNRVVSTEKKIFSVSFVGNSSYKPNWYNVFRNMDNSRIIPTPPYISEESRINIYKNSKIILGLHSEENINNKIVVERIFEALAYGAICVTDNPCAVMATQGVAIYAKDEDELKTAVNHYLNDEEERLVLSKRGLDFIRHDGLYFHRAKEFIEYRGEIN